MRAIAVCAALAGATAGVGCENDPSYALRWRVVPSEMGSAPVELESPAQCAAVGLSLVRVDTYALDNPGVLIGRREYPCFPESFRDPKGTVPGSQLDPGGYQLKVSGLSRLSLAFDGIDPHTLKIDVAEEEVVTVRNINIQAPAECVDGVDNDVDGLADGADPACLLDPTADERDDIDAATRLRVTTSFLGDSDDASCAGLGVSRFSIRVDDVEILCTACGPGPHLASLNLTPGGHHLDVVAARSDPTVDPGDGLDCSVPLTREKKVDFDGGYVDFHADFEIEDFLEPIVGPVFGPLQYRIHPDDLTHVRGCTPPSSLGGDLVVDTVRVRLLDEANEPVDPVLLNLDDAEINDDGSAVAPCFDYSMLSEDLTWGHYALEVQARAGDNVCFGAGFDGPTPAVSLAPFGWNPRVIVIPRVLDGNGIPPTGCRDCETDDDCKGCTGCCVDNVCRDP